MENCHTEARKLIQNFMSNVLITRKIPARGGRDENGKGLSIFRFLKFSSEGHFDFIHILLSQR